MSLLSRHVRPRVSALALFFVMLAAACSSGPRPLPKLLVPASKGPPKDQSLEVLLEDLRLEIDAQGRATTTRRVVYVVHDASAVRTNAMVSVGWHPWREARPILRALVTTREGTRFALDSKTIAEQPDQQSSADRLDDRRILKAPLPGLAAGARVDLTMVRRETHALTPFGGLQRIALRLGKRRLFRLVIRGPERLRYAVVGPMPLEPTADQQGPGWRQLTFQRRDFKARYGREGWLPRDRARWPAVLVSTVPSWQAVAQSYLQLLRAPLQAKVPATLLAGLPAKTAPLAERLDALLARIHQSVRYTGLEFGAAAIVPRRAAETLARGYGDCKDKSALLVAALRQLGIPARLALLNSAYGPDVTPGLPGVEAFNHAIVYLPQAKLWIDPSYPQAPAGQLPAVDQGRRALVIDKHTTELTRIPTSRPQDNRSEETRTLRLALDGRVQVHERVVTRGEPARRLRRWLRDLDAEALRKHAKGYLQRSYAASELDDVHATERGREGLELSYRGRNGWVGTVTASSITLPLRPGRLFAHVNHLLRWPGRKPRKERLVAAYGAHSRLRYIVDVPEPFRFASGPGVERRRLGGLALTVTRSVDATKRHVVLTFDLDVPRELDATQVRGAQALFARLGSSDLGHLVFAHRGAQLIDEGRGVEALALYRQAAAKDPRAAWLYADKLLELGMVEAAREVARRAVAALPRSVAAWIELGWAHELGHYGRHYRQGYDRGAALAAYRRAKAIDPSDMRPRRLLADLLRRDARGTLYDTSPKDLAAAISEYRELVDKYKDGTSVEAYGDTLLIAGQLGPLRKLLGRGPQNEARQRLQALLWALEGEVGAYARWLHKDSKGTNKVVFSIHQKVYAQLLSLRKYQSLARLHRALIAGRPTMANDTGSAAIFALARYSALKKSPTPKAPTSPHTATERAVRAFMSAMINARIKQVGALIYGGMAAMGSDPQNSPLQIISAMLRNKAALTVSLSGLTDSMAAAPLETAGDAGVGWSVAVRIAGRPAGSFYLVSTKQGPRVVGLFNMGVSVGRWVHDRLAQGAKVSEVGPALDWASRSLTGPVLAGIWPGARRATRKQVRLAAALLSLMEPTHDARPLERLLRGKLSSAERGHATGALIGVLSRVNRPAALLRALKHPGDQFSPSELLWMRAAARLELGRWRATDRWLAKRLKDNPRDLRALLMKTDLAARRHQPRAALATARELFAAAGKNAMGAMALNQAAWSVLFVDKPGRLLDEALAAAKQALQHVKQPGRIRAVKNTLAALWALRGDLRQATTFWLESRKDPLEGGDYLVHGLLAERLGLLTVARRSYQAIKANPRKSSPTSSFTLAQRGLARLDAMQHKAPRKRAPSKTAAKRATHR